MKNLILKKFKTKTKEKEKEQIKKTFSNTTIPKENDNREFACLIYFQTVLN